MGPALLLAMQASGMVVDYFATKNQQELYQMGTQIQQAGIESSIQHTRVEAEDASLQAMKKLRKTLGSQIAVMAARGTALGAGTAVSFLSESMSNFNSDERMRKMNLLAKENNLRANSVMAHLNYMSETSKLWQAFAQRTTQKISSSFAGMGGK